MHMEPLTEGEIAALGRQLELEEFLAKKYAAYALMVDDPQLKTKFEQYAAVHRNHTASLRAMAGAS